MKTVMALFAGLITLLLVLLASTYATLHTRYAADLLNNLAQHALQQHFNVHDISYDYRNPYYVQLNGVELGDKNSPIQIKQIDILFAAPLVSEQKLQIKRLAIQGLNLPQGVPSFNQPSWFNVQQLTLASVDFASQGWIVRDAHLDIKKPQPNPAALLPFYGEIKLSADQIYWQGLAINHVYIDGDFFPQHTTLYDVNFDWQQGHFSAQATKQNENKQWRIPELTITNLILQQDNLTQLQGRLEPQLQQIALNIEQFNLLNSSLEYAEFSANNLNIDAQNITLPLQQGQHDLTANLEADNISLFSENITAPQLDINVDKENLTINAFSAQMLQGDIYLKAQLTTDQLHINNLNINQLKWLPSSESKQLWLDYWTQLSDIRADNITITNSQYIDVGGEQLPPIQLSGLDIDGQNLHIKQQGKLGLWQGELNISANSVSYDKVTSEQPLIRMHTNQQHFWLDELFMPLEDGLVKAKGELDFSKTSQPWQLDVTADGLPLRFYSRWLNLPIYLDGISELTFTGHGLYGDTLGLNHSVTGRLDMQINQASTTDNFQQLWARQQGISSQPEQESSTIQDDAKPQGKKTHKVSISDIHIDADRGRISLAPIKVQGKDFSAQIKGQYDMLHPQHAKILYRLQGECQAMTFDLFNQDDSMEVENNCQ